MGESIRIGRRRYWTGVVLWVVIGAFGLLVAIRGAQWTSPLLWLGVIGAAATAWMLSRYRLSWDDDEIVYQDWRSRRRIRFADVTRVGLGGPDARDPHGPMLGLSIFSVDPSRPAIKFNARLFPERDFHRFVQELKRRGLVLQALGEESGSPIE